MNCRLLTSSICALGAFASVALASEAPDIDPQYTVQGSVQVRIEVAPPDLQNPYFLQNYSVEELSGYKMISLMNIVPSPELQEKMVLEQNMQTAEKDYSKGIIPFNISPGAVDLGMNNTPVLDQGQHGTCVTFATTSVLDALIGRGDYIDQQCSLELDKTISSYGDYWSGADFAIQVIDPLMNFGIVQKNKCFGVNYPNPNVKVNLIQYLTKSDKTSLKNTRYIYHNHNSFTLQNLKKILKSGHRVIAGTKVGVFAQGFDFKIEGKQKTGGLWSCNHNASSIDYCKTVIGGHEIAIIGFDDNQELLKIRNSWNTLVGDKGDFYMTYSFFNRMRLDATEVY